MNPNLLEKLKKRFTANKLKEEEKAIAEKEARFKRAEKAAKEYSIRQAKRLRGERVAEPEEVETPKKTKAEQNKESLKKVKRLEEKSSEKESTTEEFVNDNYQAPKKFPVQQRLLVIFIASVLAVFLGLGVGYSVLGEGNFIDVFKPSTWTHLYKIING